MKWFKHQSCARNDEKIAQLEDRAGLEGYGFYFKMLEIIAEVVDKTNKCEVIYSLSRWGRQTNIASKKWLFLSSRCADVGLMIVCRLPDDGLTKDYRISVKIPNLLKYRDNHTTNLQATYTLEEELEEEQKEIKPKSKDLSPPLASTVKKGTRLPDDWVLPKAWGDWALSEKPELTVADVRLMADTFRDHWVSTANQAKSKRLDWLATWRNWVRSPLNNKKPKPVNFNRVQESRLDWTDQLFGRNKNGNGGQIRDITPVSADQSNGESLSENVLGVWECNAS